MDTPHKMDSYVIRLKDLFCSDKPNFIIQVYEDFSLLGINVGFHYGQTSVSFYILLDQTN